MTRLSAILAFLMLTALGRAESLALVFYDAESPQQFAVLNGAKESLGDLSLRFQKKLTIQNYTPALKTITPKDQAEALKKAQKDGLSGAIIFAAKGGDKTIAEAIENLAKENFYVTVIGRDINAPSALCFILRDNEKFAGIFKKAMPVQTLKENFRLVFALTGSEEKEISKDAAESLMPANIEMRTLEAFSGNLECRFYSARSYGALQGKFAEEWHYWDNYGVIIVDERLLADIPKFNSDSDRYFVFCPQTSPLLTEYLKTSAIPLCVADDYFGYGYVASLKLFEKVFENKNPRKNVELLAPLKYVPEDLQKFESDWIKFLK